MPASNDVTASKPWTHAQQDSALRSRPHGNVKDANLRPTSPKQRELIRNRQFRASLNEVLQIGGGNRQFLSPEFFLAMAESIKNAENS